MPNRRSVGRSRRRRLGRLARLSQPRRPRGCPRTPRSGPRSVARVRRRVLQHQHNHPYGWLIVGIFLGFAPPRSALELPAPVQAATTLRAPRSVRSCRVDADPRLSQTAEEWDHHGLETAATDGAMRAVGRSPTHQSRGTAIEALRLLQNRLALPSQSRSAYRSGRLPLLAKPRLTM